MHRSRLDGSPLAPSTSSWVSWSSPYLSLSRLPGLVRETLSLCLSWLLGRRIDGVHRLPGRRGARPMLRPVHPDHHRRRKRRLGTSQHDDDYGGGGSWQNAAFAPNAARAQRGGVNQLICCALPSAKLKSPHVRVGFLFSEGERERGRSHGQRHGAGWKKG